MCKKENALLIHAYALRTEFFQRLEDTINVDYSLQRMRVLNLIAFVAIDLLIRRPNPSWKPISSSSKSNARSWKKTGPSTKMPSWRKTRGSRWKVVLAKKLAKSLVLRCYFIAERGQEPHSEDERLLSEDRRVARASSRRRSRELRAKDRQTKIRNSWRRW